MNITYKTTHNQYVIEYTSVVKPMGHLMPYDHGDASEIKWPGSVIIKLVSAVYNRIFMYQNVNGCVSWAYILFTAYNFHVYIQSLALIWNIKLRDPWIWHTCKIINKFDCETFYKVLASIWYNIHGYRPSRCDTVPDSIDKGRGGNFTN